MELVDINLRLKDYAPLVKRIAHFMKQKLPDSIEVDDLIQVGMIGLIEAAKRFNGLHGVQFNTFAIERIRGSMLDELRHEDWAPKTLRRTLRHLEMTTTQLQHRLGRAPSEAEIAKELDITLTECQQMKFESLGAQLMHYEDCQKDCGVNFLDQQETGINADPLKWLQEKHFNDALFDAIDQLPKREHRLMKMRYMQDMNLCEIGKAMGVNESRACQIHKHAVEILRVSLREYLIGSANKEDYLMHTFLH